MSPTPDWDDLKIVLAIAEHGSLGRAGRALNLAQPTISRRLHALEHALDAPLFERTRSGLVTTPLCDTLLDEIGPMARHAQAVTRKLAALDRGLAGDLSVTSIDWLGDCFIAPLLGRFGAQRPDLRLRLINDERNFNLAARDADISIAFRSLEQENLVQRTICTVAYGLYMSAQAPIPDHPSQEDGRSTLPIVMIERSDGTYLFDDWRRAIIPDSRVVLGVNSMHSVLAAVLAGGVAGILPHALAARQDSLRELHAERGGLSMDLRIGFHHDMRHTTRLRALVDFLAEALPASLNTMLERAS